MEQKPKRDLTNCNVLTLPQIKGRSPKGSSASCKRLLDGATKVLLMTTTDAVQLCQTRC
jgi:hypothetical protein